MSKERRGKASVRGVSQSAQCLSLSLTQSLSHSFVRSFRSLLFKNAESKIQNVKCMMSYKMQNAKCKMQNTKYKTRDPELQRRTHSITVLYCTVYSTVIRGPFFFLLTLLLFFLLGCSFPLDWIGSTDCTAHFIHTLPPAVSRSQSV